MDTNKNIEQKLEDLGRHIGCDDQFVKNVMSRIRNIEIEKTKTFSFRRLIMNPFSKIAAAAVTIIAALLSAVYFNSTTSVAYGFEETVKAMHSVRYLHVKSYVPDQNEPKDLWFACDSYGNLIKARIWPQWNYTEDGAKDIIFKDNKIYIWLKKKNIILIIRNDDVQAKKVMDIIISSDPKNAIQRLNELQKAGQVTLQTQTPDDKSKPIIVTALYNDQSKEVLYIDRATNLVNVHEKYKLVDGNYKLSSSNEFYDYNIPIDDSIFEYQNLPSDIMKIDQTVEVGLAQGKMSNDEVALEVVRQFAQALIDKDFKKAGKLYENIPADVFQKRWESEGIKFIKIISVGPVKPHPIPITRGVIVPLKAEIDINGNIEERTFDRIGVRQVEGQPGQWTIFGGF